MYNQKPQYFIGYKGCLIPIVTASNWIHARAYYMQPPVIYIQILCTYIFTLCCHEIQYNWHKQNNILYQRINYRKVLLHFPHAITSYKSSLQNAGLVSSIV